jgi:hypothetical protein
MSNFTVPDCLVLKLEEINSDDSGIGSDIDTVVYILFDKKKSKFIIRGQRKPTLSYTSSTYSFECNLYSDLVDFLKYIICNQSVVNETLFNYKNLPRDSNEITFESLKTFENRNNEISGYDSKKLTMRRLITNLRMLINISNFYK